MRRSTKLAGQAELAVAEVGKVTGGRSYRPGHVRVTLSKTLRLRYWTPVIRPRTAMAHAAPGIGAPRAPRGSSIPPPRTTASSAARAPRRSQRGGSQRTRVVRYGAAEMDPLGSGCAVAGAPAPPSDHSPSAACGVAAREHQRATVQEQTRESWDSLPSEQVRTSVWHFSKCSRGSRTG